MGELDAVAGKLDVAAPWTVAGADGFDAQTFESWLLGATASEPARAVFRLIAQTIYCVEPGQLSPLTVLYPAAADGGIGHMIGTVGGAQESLFVGGAWQLAAKMAEALGDAVLVNAPVRSIAQSADGVTVTSTPASGRQRWPWWLLPRRWPRGSPTARRCPRVATPSPSACRWAASSRCTSPMRRRSGAPRVSADRSSPIAR